MVGMQIKVVGPSCARCKSLEAKVKHVLAELDISAEVQKISDYMEIIETGILATPGLIINGQVKCTGRVPKEEEIMNWIKEAK